MTERQQSIWSEIKKWLKDNAMVIIAFGSLSWQISGSAGGYVYRKVSSFIDTVQITSMRSIQTQKEFSEFKVDKDMTDKRQDKDIIFLKGKK